MTCVSVCVLGLAMAMTPLTQAFVAPGSGFSAVHGRDVASSACSKVSLRGRNAVYSKLVSRATYKYHHVQACTSFPVRSLLVWTFLSCFFSSMT